MMTKLERRKTAHQILETRKAEHLEKLRTFIGQPSVSQDNNGVRECAEMLLAFFKQLGCQQAELVETPGLPAVWATYDAGAPKTLAVYGYFDTNVIGDGWDHPPFDAVVAEKEPYKSVLFGRGAGNKGGLVAFLNALSAIKEAEGELPVNLLFLTEGDEFLGSNQIPWLIERYRDQLSKADALFSPKPCQSGSGDVTLFLGNKGCLHIELACTSENWGRGPMGGPVHSSLQGVLDHPVWRLVHALQTFYDPKDNSILIEGFKDDLLEPTPEEMKLLEELARKYKGHEAEALPALGNADRVKKFANDAEGVEVFRRYCFLPTMNINGLRGGYTGPGTLLWTLPNEACCTLDMRMPPNLDPHDSLDKIRKHLDKLGYTDITLKVMEASVGDNPLSINDDLTQASLRVFKDWQVEPVIWPRRGAGGPTGFFSKMLDLKMLNSTGMSYSSGHSAPNEFIVIEGNDKVGGFLDLEKSLVDLMYSYAAYPAAY